MHIDNMPNVIGAHVTGIDLAHPLSRADFARLESVLNARSVICLRGQKLNEPQLIAFARRSERCGWFARCIAATTAAVSVQNAYPELVRWFGTAFPSSAQPAPDPLPLA
jgi:alpha-ketoglutarate-dependent taurine dioxygenase